MLDLAGRLRASRADLFEALQPEDLSPAHRFVLGAAMLLVEIKRGDAKPWQR